MTTTRTYYSDTRTIEDLMTTVDGIVSFTRANLPHGWLGNMSPHPITHEGLLWRTAEHLFQALRFDAKAFDPSIGQIRTQIRLTPSPMAAKMGAKAFTAMRVIEAQSAEDLDNMRLVLELKAAQHPELASALKITGDATIIEDVTRRPGGSGLFWGAKYVTGGARPQTVGMEGSWVGENWLGRLWMELRSALRARP